MIKPVILAVDDDRDVLGAVERDLRAKYRANYRVIAAASALEALDSARQLKKRNVPVALFLVDQRMPDMTGTQLLVEMKKLYPDATTVLLTAYADTEAAIAAINEVGLNHYLMKPWDPPEDRLYPVLDDLLSGWASRVRLPFEGVRIAGSRWSPESYAVRDFLSRNQIPYQWIDIDQDPPTRELITSIAGGVSRLPVVLFPDGTHLVTPTTLELAEKVGLQTLAKLPFYDVAIVGGGPAGLASAVYAASEGLRTLLVEHNAPGGQAGTSSLIENYLGFPSGVTGADLAQRAAAQARRFGAELLVGHSVVGFRREDPYRILRLSNGNEVSCHAVVLATGLAVRQLDVSGMAPLVGAGVYYGGALTEAAMYRGHDVCVVGGANSAGQGALFFSRYARRVTMLVRGANLQASMSQYLVDRILATGNITVMTRTEVTSVGGDGHLERAVVRHVDTGLEEPIETSALFIFIGVAPRTEMVSAGLFNSLIGYESLYAKDNMLYTRSWAADNTPYMMFGVNAKYPVNERVTVAGFIINGYYHLSNPNDQPSYGGQVAWKPVQQFTITNTLYYGPDQQSTSLEFWRLFSDNIVEWKPSDDVTVALTYDIGTERILNQVGNPRTFAMAGVLQGKWHIAGPWSVGVRPEFYWDRNGRWTGAEQFVKAVTTMAEYQFPYQWTNTVVRLEYRYDDSTGAGGGFFTRNQISPGVIGLTPGQQMLMLALLWTFDSPKR